MDDSTQTKLSQLAADKNDRPWLAETSSLLPPVMVDGSAWPKISIVTPSYNQGAYLEETIRSILSQGYPNLEYIVIDGGSRDQSVEVIRRYEPYLSYWVSEADQGQYDAINKGFSKSTGEIMAWLNSDDKYFPWAFWVVGEIFATFPQIEWITTSHHVIWDKFGRAVKSRYIGGFNREVFLQGGNLTPGSYARGVIQQESTFWRRSLWERAGSSMDTSLHMAGDFELWARFFQHAVPYATSALLGGFRAHGDQKTAHQMDRYRAEGRVVLSRYGYRHYGRLDGEINRFLRKTFRVLGVRILPPWVQSALTRAHIVHPVSQCVWEKDRWSCKDSFII